MRSTAVKAPKRFTSSMHPHHGLIARAPPAGVRSAMALERSRGGALLQQDHEAVLESRGDGPAIRSAHRASAACACRRRRDTKRTRPPSGTASTMSGRSSSRACRLRADWPAAGVAMKLRPGRLVGHLLRAGPGEHLALVQHDHVVAALRLVEIGGAEQHRAVLDRRTRRRTMSHSSRRDNGSTPTVGSSSSSSSGERTSVQARPELLLHAARQLAGETRRERARARSSP